MEKVKNMNMVKFYLREYKNNKRNGKGKEYYWDGKILFEGEYLNDKKWNGKGFDHKDDIAYELKEGKGIAKIYDTFCKELRLAGEYLNGDLNGKGKLYTGKGKLDFEGEFLNGKKHGKGTKYDFDNNLIFEGDYLKDKMWNGKRFDSDNNIIYEIKNGRGFKKLFYTYGYLIYEGEYKNGEENGRGKEYSKHIGVLEFEGESLNGKRNGIGKEYYWTGNLEFEGEYLNGKRKRGSEYNNFNNKKTFEGEYLNGKNGMVKDMMVIIMLYMN